MEAVLKVGGSLSADVADLIRLCQSLSAIAEKHKITIVPGGGEFADVVRKFDKKYKLSDEIAHKMAILGMDQYGFLLSDLIPNSQTFYSLDKLGVTEGVPIFLPSQFMFRENPLENSWDVTSDTITAHIADVLGAKKVVLVTDVDGIFLENPKDTNAKLVDILSVNELQSWDKKTSVDKKLPQILMETKISCFVVNGKHPERIKDILENKKTVCTQITVY